MFKLISTTKKHHMVCVCPIFARITVQMQKYPLEYFLMKISLFTDVEFRLCNIPKSTY